MSVETQVFDSEELELAIRSLICPILEVRFPRKETVEKPQKKVYPLDSLGRYRTPRHRYSQNKASAKQRGIPFLLSFDEWWDMWEPRWDERELYCIGRYGDTGPYEVGNCSVITRRQNLAELKDHRRQINRIKSP